MPLAFVYGLTTWAVYVEYSLSRIWVVTSWKGTASIRIFLAIADSYSLGYVAMLGGVTLYVLLNWSYTTAVVTDPGSPLSPPSMESNRAGYSHLPSQESTINPELPSFTVKSTGGTRFCKKCQARKPDRAHHCSTCRRCVLKMDHHCPWLATCVGMRNYKPFILFCAYTTIFCWVCLGVSASSLWTEISNDSRLDNGFLPVNMILLSVLSGIMGLVLTGFTGWHLSLAWRGQTTIECLEKTRYLSPLSRSTQKAQPEDSDGVGGIVQRYGQQLVEIHANALPGITRVEEGEERPSPVGDLEQGQSAEEALHMTYDERERARERQRYEQYLNEQDSEKLPNAFDLGWKKNLTNLFGDRPLLWLLPVCNTLGDGWHWEPSPKWVEAREKVRRMRESQWVEQEERELRAGWDRNRYPPVPRAGARTDNAYSNSLNGAVTVPTAGIRSSNKADQVLGRSPNHYSDTNFYQNGQPGSGMSMTTLRRKASFDYHGDSDAHYDISDDDDDSQDEAA